MEYESPPKAKRPSFVAPGQASETSKVKMDATPADEDSEPHTPKLAPSSRSSHWSPYPSPANIFGVSYYERSPPMSPPRMELPAQHLEARSPEGTDSIFGVRQFSPGLPPWPRAPPSTPAEDREVKGSGAKDGDDVKEGLVLELNASDYAHGGQWTNRVPHQPHAFVPSTVGYSGTEKAFIFSQGGDVITVPGLSTSGSAMQEATFTLWVKLLSPISKGNLGWVMSQSPDYCWSRALTLNDWRLGHVSITTSCYWDSKLGSLDAKVGQWLHVVGVWCQGGPSTVYLNGVRGATTDANNGKGSDPSEALIIGGRASGDMVHNPAVAISEVRVYNRALSDAEVKSLSERGRKLFGASHSDGYDPRVVRKLQAAQEEPSWDESTKLFWCATGVNAHDIPDGSDWQREFREKVVSAQPQARERSLRVQVSDTETSHGETSRRLARHSSDPDKRVQRAAHSSALQQMARKPGVALLVHGRKVALFRFGKTVFAVGAECPHQGGRLAEGEVGDIEDMVDGRRCYVTCPVHKFRFDLATGAVLEGTCGELQTYPVRLRMDGGDADVVVVEVGFSSLADDFFTEFGADDF